MRRGSSQELELLRLGDQLLDVYRRDTVRLAEVNAILADRPATRPRPKLTVIVGGRD